MQLENRLAEVKRREDEEAAAEAERAENARESLIFQLDRLKNINYETQKLKADAEDLEMKTKEVEMVHERRRELCLKAEGLDDEEVINKMIPSNIKARTAVIDRCSYMPKGTCPTRNSHAVKAFLFLIPGLAEHFVIGDDDIFFGRPLTPEFFILSHYPLLCSFCFIPFVFVVYCCV